MICLAATKTEFGSIIGPADVKRYFVSLTLFAQLLFCLFISRWVFSGILSHHRPEVWPSTHFLFRLNKRLHAINL